MPTNISLVTIDKKNPLGFYLRSGTWLNWVECHSQIQVLTSEVNGAQHERLPTLVLASLSSASVYTGAFEICSTSLSFILTIWIIVTFPFFKKK